MRDVECNRMLVSARKPPLGSYGPGLVPQKRVPPVPNRGSDVDYKRPKVWVAGSSAAERTVVDLRGSIVLWASGCSKTAVSLGHRVERLRLLNEFDNISSRIRAEISVTIRKFSYPRPSGLIKAAAHIGRIERSYMDCDPNTRAMSWREQWLDHVFTFKTRMHEIDCRQRQEVLSLDMVSRFLL
jgi:hypothetical protein